MAKVQLTPSSFDFLKLLKENNQRDWFSDHKASYQKELVQIENFAEALLTELNQHDVIETPSGKKSLYRIYRDTRFSTDKTPYKTHWSGSFKRATKYRRGGYYFHIEPGNSLIAGGFWAPAPDDLKRIREDIAFDDSPLRKIIADPTFIATFSELRGEQLKTTPKGFEAEHPAIDLLRYKQFLLVRRFTDKEVLSEDFLHEASTTYSNMRPFFDYMSEILSTDSDGLSL